MRQPAPGHGWKGWVTTNEPHREPDGRIVESDDSVHGSVHRSVDARTNHPVDRRFSRSLLVARAPGCHHPDMNTKTSSSILIMATVVYGIVVGILGASGSGAVGAVAVVGAGILAAGWVARLVFANRGG